MVDDGYSYLDKLLHRLALGSQSVRQASFDIEQSLVRKRTAVGPCGPHVFIAGLARAGTTALMRAIHQTGQFRSLTYRDMPFVLMPNIWHSLSAAARRKGDRRERAHADGVLVDYDSPEAFEEVFWSTFAGEQYILSDRLVPHGADEDLVVRFRNFVASVLLCAPDGATRYLSKNNNSILRLEVIRRAFPDAVILVPFRHPLAHAQSLQAQHRHFSSLQGDDPFAADYMTWLGHHEFGLTHRPFIFSEDESSRLSRCNPSQIEYWLTEWTAAYRYVLDHAPGAMFVGYEALCQDPLAILRTIPGIADSKKDFSALAGSFRPARPWSAMEIEPDVHAGALAVYKALLGRSSGTC